MAHLSGNPRVPRLYAIVDAATCQRQGLSCVEAAHHLHDAGVTLLQLRDKLSGPAEVVRTAREIGALYADVPDATLVMNDRADLAVLAGWRAVHVGHTDMPVDDVLRVLSSADGEPLVGVSTHTEEQVCAADSSRAGYVAFGPVFGTSTKRDAEPVVGLDGLRRARALTQKPLVAIGGVQLRQCGEVLAVGADSVAVISGLFLSGMSLRDSAELWLRELGA